MTSTEIERMQRRIDTAGFPLAADGQWGPKSRAACQGYLRSLMPIHSPWPGSDEVQLTRFFGKAGDESNLVKLPVSGLGVEYDGTALATIRCHKRVADSLGRIIAVISASAHKVVLSHYAGCFNFRQMRGGSRISTHSWGIAVDLAPDWNGNSTPWPEGATMPLEVMEMFAREGWLSAGAFWGRDAMHFQATR